MTLPYAMLHSPDEDGARACYLRLAPEEVQLAELMDGTRTVARLVAEFARISGRLAPDQVTRVVADLAANRMLEELPLDAFRPLGSVTRRPWPERLGTGLLAAIRGRRMLLANVDPALDGHLPVRRALAVHPGRGGAARRDRGGRAGHLRLDLVAGLGVGVPDRRLVRSPARRCCSG